MKERFENLIKDIMSLIPYEKSRWIALNFHKSIENFDNLYDDNQLGIDNFVSDIRKILSVFRFQVNKEQEVYGSVIQSFNLLVEQSVKKYLKLDEFKELNLFYRVNYAELNPIEALLTTIALTIKECNGSFKKDSLKKDIWIIHGLSITFHYKMNEEHMSDLEHIKLIVDESIGENQDLYLNKKKIFEIMNILGKDFCKPGVRPK